MAGKPITRSSGRVAYAIDRLSKNALADIILDRVAAEIGEDASEEQVLARLQGWIDTVLRLRGDKPVSLTGALKRLERTEAAYLERQRQEREKATARAGQEQRMKERIDEINREKAKEVYVHPDLRRPGDRQAND